MSWYGRRQLTRQIIHHSWQLPDFNDHGILRDHDYPSQADANTSKNSGQSDIFSVCFCRLGRPGGFSSAGQQLGYEATGPWVKARQGVLPVGPPSPLYELWFVQVVVSSNH